MTLNERASCVTTIELLKRLAINVHGLMDVVDAENCDKIIKMLNDDNPHWIPCSERLPEEHEWMGTKRFGTTISDEVYVTFENSKGERFCKHLSFQNGKLSGFDQSTIDAIYKGSKPIAWMPLPEPWGGEDK